MRLHPLPWIPAGGGEAGLAERLPRQPAAPPLVLRIDRRAAAVRDRLADLAALLSADETDRLERFRRIEDRERFLLGRGSLRLCLAALLAEDPCRLRLAATAAGIRSGWLRLWKYLFQYSSTWAMDCWPLASAPSRPTRRGM